MSWIVRVVDVVDVVGVGVVGVGIVGVGVGSIETGMFLNHAPRERLLGGLEALGGREECEE